MAKDPQRERSDAVMEHHGVPFQLSAWIEEAMQGAMGSVGNKEVFKESDFIFMIVKGPNARNDFHINPYDEIFYQLQGTATVHLMDTAGQEQICTVAEGDVMLVKAYTPHSPRRPAGTLGLVIERPRADEELDGIVWFCDACGKQLHRVDILCRDIGSELKIALDAFNADRQLRTCSHCGALLPDPTQARA